MKNQFMRVEEVAQELEVSRSYAYRLIRQLNAELHEKGYMTIAGRVNRLLPVPIQSKLLSQIKR